MNTKFINEQEQPAMQNAVNIDEIREAHSINEKVYRYSNDLSSLCEKSNQTMKKLGYEREWTEIKKALTLLTEKAGEMNKKLSRRRITG